MTPLVRRLGLVAGLIAVFAGCGFIVAPGHGDMMFRRGLGVVWLLVGFAWLTAWRRAG